MSDLPHVLIINGPNLDKLGLREPSIYGQQTLSDIESMCLELSAKLGLTIDFRQSSHEGEIVSWIGEALTDFDAIIINAAAYSHTSLAIMDAIKMTSVPVVDVHLSNVYAREEFRHSSYVARVATGVISGFGAQSYLLALRAVTALLETGKD
ncbi:MAG: type II 3-dehydroquinate dehydratase [Alphaproteobacteria bacterium]|nr:type II 3-dehydroquinate dehydratase [Alphaproteobacteria bacterium]